MCVAIEVWRGRIGMFNRSFRIQSSRLLPRLPSGLITALMSIHTFMIIHVLLVIGNVEVNPGPDLVPCPLCPFKAMTADQHIYHQRIHEGLSNFRYVCPYSMCRHSYDNFRSLNSHLSCHNARRDEVAGEINAYKCAYCDAEVKTNREYCDHIKNSHFDQGLRIQCPFPENSCSRAKAFTFKSQFSVHLSQCHPGWRHDYSSTTLQKPAEDDEPMEFHVGDEAQNSAGNEEINPPDGVDISMDFAEYGVGADDSDDSDGSLDSEEGYGIYMEGFDHDQVVNFLANFYIMMEGKLLVPYSSVDEIARRLLFITEILHQKLKKDLTTALSSVGLSETNISRVIQSVLSMDPLYNVHHRNAPGPSFLTHETRLTYYKNHFRYQDTREVRFKKDPRDMEHLCHYNGIDEAIEIMLEDPSIQKQVDQSFEKIIPDNPTIIRDYTDGSVARNSNAPRKRVDLFVYMDGFNCCEPCGSAALKHKVNGMYMTLGNLKPHNRSFLKAMRLVLIVNDKSLKVSEAMFQKVFRWLIRDLKHLETNGIMYKDENVPVRLQFVLGDNLGQHTLGGFIEVFSGIYFCRFCHITRDQFKEDQEQDVPVFRTATWRTPASYDADLQLALAQNENHRGIKRNSPFHQLQHFNVCEPRLPPCVGHDIFIDGVVDRDGASMINHFISEGWFTLEELNARIKKFEYLGIDMRNKPAPFKGGSRLKGHAVENWTLFRLLPLLIGDRVRTDDEVWKLYLLLKSTIELICAPALTTEQIEVMRTQINDYMGKRKILPNSYQPKHHFFAHYPDLYLMFGPLIFLWTLGWEHRHQFFKRVARICRNFKNLGHTLSFKCQLLQAFQSLGPLFPEGPVFSHSSPLNAEMYEDDLKSFLQTCNFSGDATELKQLTVNEINYKRNQWLLLRKSGTNNNIYVGKIELLVCTEGTCKAVVTKYKARRWKKYGLYYIVNDDTSRCLVSLEDGSLENPCPHAVYMFGEHLCFSLKHVFLNRS